jgi:class 3 adenylate cyclase/tetratricopeptide (TPR) repeat protein
MPVCPNCAKDNPDGAKFCLECGTPFAAPACPSCGTENPAGAKFCLECGTALAGVVAPAPTEPEPTTEERKVVTALFTDIVGSTASAEKLDPEDVRARLSPYYARLRSELEAYGGTVEKFIGDAVVALFGAPVAHEDDPERAVRAALAITEAVAELNEEDEWLDLHIRTAVHTGEALVVVGASAERGEGMAAGDVMNTAARLQSGAPVDGIAVGEATYRATQEVIEYREGEPVQAKGKTEPIPIWVVVGEKETLSRPRVETSLVGRAAELEYMTGLWEQVRTQARPQLATVVGPPGIGKSRLLVAVCERAERDGTVYWGRCLPYGEGITYWPVTEILKDAAGVPHDDDAEQISTKLGVFLEGLGTNDPSELRTMAATLANLIGVPTTPRGTYLAAEISQAELHWGIRRVFRLLAQKRPLLLVFEDLHWAEPTLLELIGTIVGGGEQQVPLLLVGSARPEISERQPEFILEDTVRHEIELEALSEADSKSLLAELVGPEAAAGGALERLLENAGGNPLFLEETVRMLADAAQTGEIDLEQLPIPDSLQALIGSRLDGLPAAEKGVAQQASVVGAVFWAGAVAHLAGTNGDLTPRLAGLEQRDFVRAHEESTVAGEREYAFKHILIRDVAYERLPKGRRAQLHVLFSDWLTELTGGDDEFVEILAYHLDQACRHARAVAHSPVEPPVLPAVDALIRSAQKAERREGLREADRFYARALELVGDEYPELRLELRLRRGRTLIGLGELRVASDELADVAGVALAAGRRDLRCDALVALGNIGYKQSSVAEARGHLTEAASLAAELGERVLGIRAAYEFAALSAQFDLAGEEALADLQGALAIAEELDDRSLRIEGHLRAGVLLFNRGKLAEADRQLELCSALAGEVGSLKDEARATTILSLVRYYRGSLEESERLALEAFGWLERTCDTFFQLQNSMLLGIQALVRSDPHLAEERLREALPLALETGGWLLVGIYRYLTEALVSQGRVDEARELVAFAARSVPKEDAYARAYLLVAEAVSAAAAEEQNAATASFEEALRVFEKLKVPIDLGETRIAFARALRSFGEEAGARTELERARTIFKSLEASAMLDEIDRELAEVGSGAGRADPAASSL